MKILVALLAVVALSGCAEFTALKSGVGTYSQKAADDALDVKVWSLCNVTSRGSVERNFDTPEKKRRLDEFCAVFFGTGVLTSERGPLEI